MTRISRRLLVAPAALGLDACITVPASAGIILPNQAHPRWPVPDPARHDLPPKEIS